MTLYKGLTEDDTDALPLDVHMNLERDLASFLGAQSAIIYAQAFSTISSVIPAFAKRGDIIIADRGCSFSIRQGIQISRTTVKWYDHGDLGSLEEVLEGVRKEEARRGGKLTRRFIVTEGIFENDGVLTDLPRLVSPCSHSIMMMIVLLMSCFDYSDRAQEEVQVQVDS